MDKNVIRKIITRIKTKEQLLELLNRMKEEDSREGMFTFYPFEIKQINYYCNPNHAGRYRQFRIPKKAGGERIISMPAHALKNILFYLNEIFLSMYEPMDCVYGFAHGRSIVDNARKHLHKNYVFNIDLVDFFTSINQARVWGRLQAKPYRLQKEMANIIAGLCAMQMEMPDKKKRNVLPQGAPTSPILTNMICERMDWLLTRLAKKYHVEYSRYADDMTFSSSHNVYQADGEFRKELKRIIEGQGFTINPKKTRLQKKGNRQEVTGLIVGEKANVSRSYVKNIRSILHIWEKFGKSEAQRRFLKPYMQEKARKLAGTPRVESVVEGKLLFMKMVKGENDPTFSKLWTRYKSLTDEDSLYPVSYVPEAASFGFADRQKQLHVHFPKEVVEFLTEFTRKESPLKFTTHPWDTGCYDSFESFVEQYKMRLNMNTFWSNAGGVKRLFNCDSELYYIIYNFLIREDMSEKNYWGRYHLRIGYLSPKGYMSRWLAENPGKQPSEMPLGILPKSYLPQEKVGGETLVNFDQVINIFKDSIEFRGNSFHDMIRRIFHNPEIQFDRSGLDTLRGYNFYTDTYKIERAVSQIRNNITSRPGEHKVRVWASRNEENTQLCLHILHVGSFSDSNPEVNRKLLLMDKGNLVDLVDNLKGLCNFYVESRFRDENDDLRRGVISYLYETPDGNPRPKYLWLDGDAVGFDYILKFYI